VRGMIALLLVATAFGCSATTAPTAARHTAGHSERLVARARRGDRVARAALVDEHMGLVRSIAFRYRNLGLATDDLVQEGAIGLLSAIDDYDPARGSSFSTYAFWRIRAAITHAVTAHGNLLRIPRPVIERRRQLALVRERLGASGRTANVRELAAAINLPSAAVEDALAPLAPISLDQPLADDSVVGDHVAVDAADPEALAVRAHETRALRAALQHLRPRKQAIVRRHYGIDGEPETLASIASDLHISPERTRALKEDALRELANALEVGAAA